MIETRQIVLRCGLCNSQRPVVLSMSQVRRLAAGYPLQLHCSFCSSPQSWAPAEPLDLSQPSCVKPAQAKSILLVDDDDLILKLLQKALESSETEIEVAVNGREALSKLAARNFDLMICDIQMPEMTGQELFQHIQDNALLPPQRILFLTGDQGSDVKKFLDSSGCYYLYKPIHFLEFSGQVQEMLSKEAAG